jgi:hypothetical protein
MKKYSWSLLNKQQVGTCEPQHAAVLCRICRAELPNPTFARQYPNMVCDQCGEKALNLKGKHPEHVSINDQGDNPVFIEGKKCWRRYRFGGYVTMLDDTDCQSVGEFMDKHLSKKRSKPGGKSKMKGLLVRVGIDSSREAGGWNAPVLSGTREFAFVTIPEKQRPHPKLGRYYGEEFAPALNWFHQQLPSRLREQRTHLDPDFEYLTYGDGGSRGKSLATLETGDLLAFFAGLRDFSNPNGRLIYALIGLYVVDKVQKAADIPKKLWRQSAHTRRAPNDSEYVVTAKTGVSGRLKTCIPIGEHRERAYRVRKQLLKEWGGLGVKNGYIQRSAHPPMFCDPARFYRWFRKQRPKFVEENNIPPKHI